MTIESATYIDTLDATKPASTDLKSEGDDHMRLIKTVVKATFPNVTGAVTMTHTQLNSIPNLAPLASPALTGTPTVPTATLADSTTKAASTAFVQNAIAAVNAQAAPTTLAIDSTTPISATAGQHIVCTNAGVVTVNLPGSPTAGQTVWITPGNDRVDNVIGRGGSNIMSLAEDMTINNANITVALRYINSTLGWRLV
jgi:hypothetical protein